LGRLIAVVLVNAIALIAIIIVVPGVEWPGATELGPVTLQVLAVALILGIANTFVKPVVSLLALPVRLMTLGAVGFLINAGMLLVVAWLAGQLGFAFSLNGFPPDLSIEAIATAVVAAIVMGIVTAVVNLTVNR
jgi:putative membrane protein